jgi:hypothetical protein
MDSGVGCLGVDKDIVRWQDERMGQIAVNLKRRKATLKGFS